MGVGTEYADLRISNQCPLDRVHHRGGTEQPGKMGGWVARPVQFTEILSWWPPEPAKWTHD